MGACEYSQYGKGETVQAAFNAATNQAAYEHGHGGYTGTLAEKGDYVLFDYPEPSRRNAESIAEDLAQCPETGDPAFERLLAVFGDSRKVERAIEMYDDKWADAVALPSGSGEWLFCGWASA